MFSLSYLPWIVLAAAGAYYWWQSGKFKGRARDLAIDHCRRLDLQLLDHSMVISGLWPVRETGGKLMLRRTYQFEFTSTGEYRYQGILVLEGMRLKSIHLEAYKLPEQDAG